MQQEVSSTTVASREFFAESICFSFESTRNSDESEGDCFESSAKEMGFQSPLQPNAHLYSYGSNLELPDFENSSGLAPKTQK